MKQHIEGTSAAAPSAAAPAAPAEILAAEPSAPIVADASLDDMVARAQSATTAAELNQIKDEASAAGVLQAQVLVGGTHGAFGRYLHHRIGTANETPAATAS
ncbi:hypothetical protein [Frondihabitans sucicola]|uniref:hypothetical protein n=1 Tax=Frondihabitans sucicola TaxID=1268041 RepID=UPI00257480E7|nr:hypothetical protein [Frondihabitans sucicola]